jgi:chromate reductase, NAD(P)H dehydrogenase (quinone)
VPTKTQSAQPVRPQQQYAVKVLVFGASLSKTSLNDRLATLAAQVLARNDCIVDRAHMADFDCPSYDFDVEKEGRFPGGAQRLKERLLDADAFVIASPEYNASMPGVLKNVIDWTSRLRPQPWIRRQGLLMSASPSMGGGNRGLWALRVPLEHLGARVYPDMFSLAQAHEAFDAQGTLASAELQARFESTLKCFTELVEAAQHYRAIKTQWVEFLGEHPDEAIDRVETAQIKVA